MSASKPKNTQLTESQRELYEAMQKGAKCRFMPYMGTFNPSSYYFRTDTMKRCTVAARALLKRKLVEITQQDWRGHTLVVVKPVESEQSDA